MKIDIITMSCATNYGAVLQTYALTDFLLEQGYDVEVIDYVTERYHLDAPGYADNYVLQTRFFRLLPVMSHIWSNCYLPRMIKNKEVFRKFLNKYLPLTHPYYSNDELKSDKPVADIYITGSDQVWNSDFTWNGQIDLPYYLDFTDETDVRISYASSFGKEKISEEEESNIRSKLHKYHNLSVREPSGQNILKGMGLEGTVAADPTILCNLSSYEKLTAGRVKDWEEKHYILLFMIRFDKKLYQLSNRLAKETQKRLIVILPSCQDARKCKEHGVVLPSVEDWILYIRNADYMVTNSFHGTVISILNNTRFASSMMIGNNGRIKNLLGKAGLNGRKYESYHYETFLKLYHQDINFKKANERIDVWRRESQKWLLGNIHQALEDRNGR